MSRPSPVTAKAGTRCRTKAPSSPRCSPAREPKTADHRSVRRGRRQDLGARGADGKYRASSMPMIADRMRLQPDLRAAEAGGGAQRPGAGRQATRAALDELEGKMDLVLIDAPCTGSGVWRRRPDAKWRLSPQMLEARLDEQRAVLDEGARLVKPAGRLAYITCSVLPSENRDQVDAFLARHPEFKLIALAQLWEQGVAREPGARFGRRRGRHPAYDAPKPRHRRFLRRRAGAAALVGDRRSMKSLEVTSRRRLAWIGKASPRFGSA